MDPSFSTSTIRVLSCVLNILDFQQRPPVSPQRDRELKFFNHLSTMLNLSTSTVVAVTGQIDPEGRSTATIVISSNSSNKTVDVPSVGFSTSTVHKSNISLSSIEEPTP